MADMNELVQNLLNLDEEELEAQLGMRAQSIGEDLARGESRGASVESLEVELAVPRGPAGDKAIEIGRRIFNRVYAEAYELLCTPLGGDEKTEKELDKALEESYTKAASFLAPVLVSSFGLAPVVATIIATLIIKKIAKDLAGGVCSTWAKTLNNSESAAAKQGGDSLRDS